MHGCSARQQTEGGDNGAWTLVLGLCGNVFLKYFVWVDTVISASEE